MQHVKEKHPPVKALEVFAGLWHAEGDVYARGGKAPTRWKSHEHYAWLPGEQFMGNRWQAIVGGHPFEGLAVFGHDKERGYFSTFYDNAGNSPGYRVTVEGRRWTFSGEAQRAVYELAEDGRSMKIHWDAKGEDGAWQPLCDLKARRERSPAEIVQTLFAAYDAGDRVTAEELLDEDFRFSSPRDDRIDKRAWFERCWPNSDKLCAFRIERLCERDDGEVFVRYSAERVADGVRFRNIELWRVVEGRVREIDVYFGRDLQS
jgi:ketosteroid isomerase-like protein